MKSNRLLIKIDKEYLPQIKDRYPFVYLEKGRLEVDDSSVKWIDSEGRVIPLPISTIQSLLLGPGTSVTHEAIKVLAMVNCMVSWVGEDSLLYYASGQTPTQNTRNLVKQLTLYSDPQKRLKVAKKLFSYRFPNTDIEKKSLKELMGMEGIRVKNLYYDLSVKYDVLWHGRNFKPGEFQISDLTNKCITACNTALYSLINACVHSMGLSPKIGFIHSGSPLPFVYDIADLYKPYYSLDLAFSITKEMAGVYLAEKLRIAFVKRVVEGKLLEQIPKDISCILGLKNDNPNNE